MVPDGWKQSTVEDLCKQVSVGIVIKPAQYYVDESVGTRAFRSANVREGSVNDTDWVYLSDEGHQTNKKSILKSGDVLVVRSGYPGTACVVTEEYAGSNCIDVIFARPNTDVLLPEYLAAFTNSDVGKRQIFGMQGGLAQKHLNVGAYKGISLPLPPVIEQAKIIEILSMWDNAIAAAEALVANCVRQKRSFMQSVFSQEGNDMQEFTLDDLFEFKRGEGLSKNSISADGNADCVLYGELYTTYREVIRKVKSRTRESSDTRSRYGDILIPSSTTTTGIDLANVTCSPYLVPERHRVCG